MILSHPDGNARQQRDRGRKHRKGQYLVFSKYKNKGCDDCHYDCSRPERLKKHRHSRHKIFRREQECKFLNCIHKKTAESCRSEWQIQDRLLQNTFLLRKHWEKRGKSRNKHESFYQEKPEKMGFLIGYLVVTKDERYA